MKRFIILFMFIFSTSAENSLAANKEFICGDITNVDFKNMNISLENQRVQFKAGKAKEYFEGLAAEEKNLFSNDKMEKDVILSAPDGPAVRVLQILREETGTGSWTFILGYICDDKHVKQIFDRHYEGKGFDKVSDLEILVTYFKWNKQDSHARPSVEVKDLYKWSPKKKEFLLEKQTAAKTN